MSEDDREIARLWKVNRTANELVRDRGYEVADYELEMDLETFRENYAPEGKILRSKMLFYASKTKTNPDDEAEEVEKIMVYYAEEKAVGIKTMRGFIDLLDDKKISKGIMIYHTSITPTANKLAASVSAEFGFQIDLFQEADLLVNITHHVLVPEHQVLSPAEKKELLQKYRLKDSQLPRIQLTDPVARYYGLRRGQVVKITRPSETSGRYCSYRLAM